MKFSTELDAVLDPAAEERAVQTLRNYFTPWPLGRFTGSWFERLGGGGDRPEVANTLTAEDLTAVSMLAVDIPGSAALMLLEVRRRRLDELFARIPTNLDLVDVDPAVITPEWPAWQLYTELRGIDDLGPTKVSKLLARKRPRLIPIRDKVVAVKFGLQDNFWQPLAARLRENDGALHKHLLYLRDAAGVGDDVSPLRILDVLAWCTGKHYLPKAAIEPKVGG